MRGSGIVRFIRTVLLLPAILYWDPAASQSAQWITISKDALAFHEEKFRELNMKMEPSIASDAEILVELVGLPNISKINALRVQIRRILGFNNAAALEGEGYRSIVYDPEWAAGDTAGFYLVLGHETGHHFCGHSANDTRGNRAEEELQADQFGGAAIKRFEIYHKQSFFDQVVAAAITKYPASGSFLYPSRAQRIEALKRGYIQGSGCGDLAPVEQSGFTPATRSNGTSTPCRVVKTGPTSYACDR